MNDWRTFQEAMNIQPAYPSQAPRTIGSIGSWKVPNFATKGVKVSEVQDEQCLFCSYADSNKWFGLASGQSHCRKCHATFGGAEVHDVSCHRTFGSYTALYLHVRNNKCNDPTTLVRKNGDLIYGEPRTNKHGTLVWRTKDKRQWIG